MDSAAALIVLTARAVAFGTLLLTGVAHIRSRGGLAAQLLQQGVFSGLPRRVISVALGPMEAAIGVLGLTAMTLEGSGRAASPTSVAGVAGVALYTGFAVFALYLWRRAPGAPCGCARDGERASGWIVSRAAVLTVCAAAGLASVPGGALSSGALAYSGVVAVALGLLIWQLPSAMEIPEREVP